MKASPKAPARKQSVTKATKSTKKIEEVKKEEPAPVPVVDVVLAKGIETVKNEEVEVEEEVQSPDAQPAN